MGVVRTSLARTVAITCHSDAGSEAVESCAGSFAWASFREEDSSFLGMTDGVMPTQNVPVVGWDGRDSPSDYVREEIADAGPRIRRLPADAARARWNPG